MCPNCIRPIPVWEHKKEIPAFHIRESLKTLGVSQLEFLKWLDEN